MQTVTVNRHHRCRKTVDQKMVQVPVLVRMKRLPHVLHSQAASRAVGLALRRGRRSYTFGKLVRKNDHEKSNGHHKFQSWPKFEMWSSPQKQNTRYLNVIGVIGAQRTNRVGNPPKKYMQSLLFFFIVTVL